MSNVRAAGRWRWPTGPKSVVMTTRYPLDHPGGSKASLEHLWTALAGVKRVGAAVTWQRIRAA